MNKKFYLSKNDKVIGGVCGGISDYIGMDVTIVRIVSVLALLAAFPIFFLYVVTWVVAPEK